MQLLRLLVLLAILSISFLSAAERQPCATCPDTSMVVLISTNEIATNPNVFIVIRNLENAFNDTGIKTISLIGTKESLPALENYLSCPKLRVWARFTSETSNSMTLGSGTPFTTATIYGMKDLIKGKIFPFSCRDVGATFLGAMITAGAQFVTANNGLAINTLNDWCAYLKDIILSNTELIASFNTLLASKNWVYKADGPGPFYVFPPVAIHPSQTGKSLQDGLTIVCYQGRVTLSCNSPAGAFHFSVFTLSGKEIYSTILSTPETVWNMNTTNGKPVLSGPYVFVLKNNGKNVKKRVMLFR